MIRAALILAALAGCAVDAPPTITIVPDGAPPPTTLAIALLHGDGDTTIAERWGVPDTVEVPEDVDTFEVTTRSILLGQGTGGTKAWELACAKPYLVAAIVIVGSEVPAGECADGRVSVLHIHGTHDDVVNYNTVQVARIRERALADCNPHNPDGYLETPPIGADSVGCSYWMFGTNYSAAHWRTDWDHNPEFPPDFANTVITWAVDHAYTGD